MISHIRLADAHCNSSQRCYFSQFLSNFTECQAFLLLNASCLSLHAGSLVMIAPHQLWDFRRIGRWNRGMCVTYRDGA